MPSPKENCRQSRRQVRSEGHDSILCYSSTCVCRSHRAECPLFGQRDVRLHTHSTTFIGHKPQTAGHKQPPISFAHEQRLGPGGSCQAGHATKSRPISSPSIIATPATPSPQLSIAATQKRDRFCAFRFSWCLRTPFTLPSSCWRVIE